MKKLSIPAYLSLSLCIMVGGPARAADLMHMSSIQRVAHFERFLTTRPDLRPTSGTQQVRLIRAWLDDQRATAAAIGAEHVLELVDVYLRRQGAFKQNEAFGWLGTRLAHVMNTARESNIAADRAVLRLYADAALVFSAGPIPSRLSKPVGDAFFDDHLTDERDRWAYFTWRNRTLKAFITNLAERVPGSPVGEVARTRWFFEIYHEAGCDPEFTGVAADENL